MQCEADRRRDDGARFRKCDLQVHTPRDPGWSGLYQGITTDDERQEYARAFIVDCRRRELDAVAITDHHDICLFRWIRDAAANEAGSDGQPVREDERIAVFPGMELTLSEPPLQALLILDPDLSDEILGRIPAALNIGTIPADQDKHAPVTPLAARFDLHVITETLANLVLNPEETDPKKKEYLGGRFILLPHVRKGGHKAIIRNGFNMTYAEMPCVGGYIEGRPYEELEAGNRCILEGNDLNWGSRAIGVFTTSDCRSARRSGENDDGNVEFPDLGKWPTWVKWTRPSAEALRQACLARASRLSVEPPRLPSSRLVSVTVRDAKFIQNDTLSLNPQLNAFIGGRGTGKSSLFEYIRWALCDSPIPSELVDSSGYELPDYQKRRRSLIDKTLRPDGRVIVEYEKNGVIYSIERSAAWNVEKSMLSRAGGEEKEMPGAQVRREFPIVSYAQKQMSCVGTLPDEIRRLVEDPVREEVSRISEDIDDVLLPKLRELRQRQLRLNELESIELELEEQCKALREQIAALQSTLKGLSEEDQATISTHDAIVREQRWIEDIRQVASQLGTAVDDAIQAMGTVTIPVIPDGLPHVGQLEALATAVRTAQDRVTAQLRQLKTDTSAAAVFEEAGETAIREIQAEHEKHRAAYDRCLGIAESNRQQMDQLKSLNQQLEQGMERASRTKAEAATLREGLEEAVAGAWSDWLRKHGERSDLLTRQCEAISEQAQRAFRAVPKPCGSLQPMIAALGTIAEQGANIRDRDGKVRALAVTVAEDPEPLAKWQAVIDEFQELVDSKEAAVLPSTPLLTQAGFSDANRSALAQGASRETLESVRYVSIPDDIIFEFAFGRQTDGSPRFIPFTDASPGQQATALMKTLLAEEGAPLLIDQPEEDLDNVQIREVADDVCGTKQNRQLIFISHNANIVVNGDAELVVRFDYSDPEDRTKGIIERSGSIDFAPIREIITSVMEGGREAFDLSARSQIDSHNRGIPLPV